MGLDLCPEALADRGLDVVGRQAEPGPGQAGMLIRSDTGRLHAPSIFDRMVRTVADSCHRVAMLSSRQRSLKRAMDVVGASAAMVVLGPSIIAIGVAIRRTMGRPVLYRQLRVGRHGRPFVMLKFRTMVEAPEPVPTITVADDGRPASGGCSAAAGWTSCRSCGACFAVTCPWWARDRMYRATRIASRHRTRWWSSYAYLDTWSFRGDCLYLLATLHPAFERWLPAASRLQGVDRSEAS
jgi:hypothetical protein